MTPLTTTPTTRTRLILATGNRHKIEELADLLGNAWDVEGIDALEVVPAEETGSTFEENAILKSEAIARQTGLPSLADDSGLEVDALGGAPGVYSARYAGPQHDDADNRALLLKNMEVFDVGERTCRFVCVVALTIPGEQTVTVRGTCEGTVGRQEVGTNGFGYDALFVLPDGRTLAQLEPEEKNRVSHRARAMALMLPILDARLGGTAPS